MSILNYFKQKLNRLLYLDILAPPIEFTNNGKARSHSVLGLVFSISIFIISLLSAKSLILNILTNSNPKVTTDYITINENYTMNFNETLKNSFFFKFYYFNVSSIDSYIINTSELEPIYVYKRNSEDIGQADVNENSRDTLESCSEEFLIQEYLSSEALTEEEKNNRTVLENLKNTTMCFPYVSDSEISYYKSTSIDMIFSPTIDESTQNTKMMIIEIYYKQLLVDRSNFIKPYKIQWMTKYYFIDYKWFNSYYFNVQSSYLDIYESSFILEEKRGSTLTFGTLDNISGFIDLEIPVEYLQGKIKFPFLQLSFFPTYQSKNLEIRYTTYDELLSTLGGTFSVIVFFFQLLHEYLHDCFFKAHLLNSIFLFHKNDYLNDKEGKESFHKNTKINLLRTISNDKLFNSDNKNDINNPNGNPNSTGNSKYCDSNLQVSIENQDFKQDFDNAMNQRTNHYRTSNIKKVKGLIPTAFKTLIDKIDNKKKNDNFKPELVKYEIMKTIFKNKSSNKNNDLSNISNIKDNYFNNKPTSDEINSKKKNNNAMLLRKMTTSDSDKLNNLEKKNTYKSNNKYLNTNEVIKEIDDSNIITINSLNHSYNNNSKCENVFKEEVKNIIQNKNKNNTCKNLYYKDKYQIKDNFYLPFKKSVSENKTLDIHTKNTTHTHSKFNNFLIENTCFEDIYIKESNKNKVNYNLFNEDSIFSNSEDHTNTMEMKYDDNLINYDLNNVNEKNHENSHQLFDTTHKNESNKNSENDNIDTSDKNKKEKANDYKIKNKKLINIENKENKVERRHVNENIELSNTINNADYRVINSENTVNKNKYKDNFKIDSNSLNLVNNNNQSTESNILLNKNKLIPVENRNNNQTDDNTLDNRKLFSEVFKIKKSRTANHISTIEAMKILGCCGCFSSPEKYEKHNLITKACSVLENKLNINNYFNLFFDIEMIKRMVILMSFSMNHLQNFINDSNFEYLENDNSKENNTDSKINPENDNKGMRRKRLGRISSSNFIDEYIVKNHTKIPAHSVLNQLFSVIKLITPPSYSTQNQYSGDKLLSDYNNKEINQEYWNNSILDIDILNACYSNLIEGKEKSDIHPTAEIEMILLNNVLDSII